jgi:hypothetical protein
MSSGMSEKGNFKEKSVKVKKKKKKGNIFE